MLRTDSRIARVATGVTATVYDDSAFIIEAFAYNIFGDAHAAAAESDGGI
jgi:hypothetical protein